MLVNASTALSLLLCLAAAAVGLRSMWVGDTVKWSEVSKDGVTCDVLYALSSKGGLRLGVSHYAGLTYTNEPGHFHYSQIPPTKYPLYDRSRVNEIRGFGALGFEMVIESKSVSPTNPRQFWVQRTL